MTQYILRFDDITPEFLSTKEWSKMDRFLKKFQLKVILGVIPYSKDEKLKVNGDYSEGIKVLKKLNQDGHLIAIHGCHHKLTFNNGSSLVPINNFGEFSGKSLLEQRTLLKKAYEWFLDKDIIPKAWMAPAHSFDEATIKCLKDLNIHIISDGLFLGPRLREGMIWIPQQIWRFKKLPFGCWTICIHLLEISDNSLENLKSSIECNISTFINPSSLFEDIKQINNFSNIDNLIQKIILKLLEIKNKIKKNNYEIRKKIKG